MSTIKISSVIEERVREEFKALVATSHRSIAGLLNEAISDYVRRRRVRPAVMEHLERSIDENRELGRLLAPVRARFLDFDHLLAWLRAHIRKHASDR